MIKFSNKPIRKEEKKTVSNISKISFIEFEPVCQPQPSPLGNQGTHLEPDNQAQNMDDLD